MPEAGYIPIPRKLAEKGVKDMLRISDARMSGTAYGTIVLHVSPEAEAGGPIGVVRSGDRIKLSVAGRRLDLEVDAAELERRRAERPRSDEGAKRGWQMLYRDHVLQAEDGCDLDFLASA
jgi:dihydroxy-acid dehydratase